MIFNFGNLAEEFHNQCEITIQLGDKVVQSVSIPFMFARQQFEVLTSQIAQDSRPMKVVCRVQELTEKGRPLNNYISFANNAFISTFGEDGEE